MAVLQSPDPIIFFLLLHIKIANSRKKRSLGCSLDIYKHKLKTILASKCWLWISIKWIQRQFWLTKSSKWVVCPKHEQYARHKKEINSFLVVGTCNISLLRFKIFHSKIAVACMAFYCGHCLPELLTYPNNV